MKKLAALCALFCLLAGCAPHAREPEGLALVRVLGVDGVEKVTLTAVCAGQNGEKGTRGEVTANSLADALERLPRSGDREMALTNVSHIIINMDADLEEVLAGVLLHRELNPSAAVWLAEDAAGLLAGCPNPEERLEVLGEEGAVTVFAALAGLETEGRTELPRLAEKDGILQICGMMVKEGRG